MSTEVFVCVLVGGYVCVRAYLPNICTDIFICTLCPIRDVLVESMAVYCNRCVVKLVLEIESV